MQASLAFPGAESYHQTAFQTELIAASDTFFGLAFACELAAHLAVYSPRRYYRDWQSSAEFLVVMLFGVQSAVQSAGGALPFHPFLLRLVRMVHFIHSLSPPHSICVCCRELFLLTDIGCLQVRYIRLFTKVLRLLKSLRMSESSLAKHYRSVQTK